MARDYHWQKQVCAHRFVRWASRQKNLKELRTGMVQQEAARRLDYLAFTNKNMNIQAGTGKKNWQWWWCVAILYSTACSPLLVLVASTRSSILLCLWPILIISVAAAVSEGFLGAAREIINRCLIIPFNFWLYWQIAARTRTVEQEYQEIQSTTTHSPSHHHVTEQQEREGHVVVKVLFEWSLRMTRL